MEKVRMNLLVGNEADIREGWTNIDPLAPENDHRRIRANPMNLDPVCDAGEVDELVAHDLIDTLPYREANEVLDHWISRLAHGGTITLSCVDTLEVTKMFQNRSLMMGQLNALLHGEQTESWKFRQGSYHLGQLANILTSKGLVVLQKRIHQFRAIIVAQRP